MLATGPRFARLPWIGIVIGGVLLVWVLRDLDLARLLAVLKAAEAWPLAILPVATIVETGLRAEKWRQMLTPLGSVGRTRLFGAIMAGYLANMLAPIRVSPLVRAWLVARLEGLSTGSLLATIALDRLVDGFVFLGFAALALLAWRFPDPEGVVRQGITLGAAISLVLLLSLLAVLVALRRGTAARLRSLLSIVPWRRLPDRWRAVAGGFAQAFVQGVVWPRETWRTVVIVAASVAMKLIAVSFFVWAGLAFGVRLRPEAYLFLMVFLGFLMFLAGTLRIVGGFTAGAVFALEALGVEVETALAMVVVVEASTHLTVACTGSVALWRLGFSSGRLRRASRDVRDVDDCPD
jgi:uncharacterized membrane protein YbhN (UPF0104 family)